MKVTGFVIVLIVLSTFQAGCNGVGTTLIPTLAPTPCRSSGLTPLLKTESIPEEYRAVAREVSELLSSRGWNLDIVYIDGYRTFSPTYEEYEPYDFFIRVITEECFVRLYCGPTPRPGGPECGEFYGYDTDTHVLRGLGEQ